jgi:hypothetical protein
MKKNSKVSKRIVIFILLSAADLALTSVLIQNSRGNIYESNLIAAEWLMRFGWGGLAVFKLTDSFLVVGICGLLALHDPRVASRVATVGCLALGGVVIYSSFLFLSANP